MNESNPTLPEATQAAPSRAAWPDYRAIWRWHFYAGLFCIPFVILLSITGGMYLFKEEIDSALEGRYDNLAASGTLATPSNQVAAAIASVPGSSLQGYELPDGAGKATRVIVQDESGATRVFVNPLTCEVLGSIKEEDRFTRVLFKIHGELLMGDRGSNVVELASSWAIVMILTGLVLWWPRGSSKLAGVVYPRLNRGSRIFWRDIHGVTGMWISGLALFLLLTGLPWAKFWGDYFKYARKLTGTAVARQDWSNGSQPAPELGGGDHSMHGGGRRRGKPSGPLDDAALDRAVASVAPLNLPPPVLVHPPGARVMGAASPRWTAKSMTANRPLRVDLELDGQTGEITSRKDFSNRHILDRIVGTGVAAHEGRLFGWPNQLLGLLTAVGLLLVSVSSVVMWWRRREPGTLGAPAMLARPRFSAGLVAVVVLLGVYLPLFGASLAAVLVLEWALLKRIPPVRNWLGLNV